ncbi:hypothetical protein V1517DRAFT_348948 [Lipomyces orientalis]|uniref:Uncharacterized protein n=1 Tax=Lipomyces orientalis TaxID=1233043 RepID=A0ACC3TEN2_9ASCO
MSTSKPTFNPRPAWSEPFCITPESRVRYLRTLLLDKSQEYQHKNILFLIYLYETGQLRELRPGTVTWIFDGTIVDDMPKEIPKGSAVWAESIGLQLMQTTQTPQPLAVQMPQSASYGLQGIFAKFRLPAVYGGQANIILDVSIANDTGSDRQTIFATDLAFLDYNPYTYTGRLGPIFMSTASGGIYRKQIFIEMQISRADGTAVSPWFAEIAVITPAQPGVPQYRLSGNAMRNFLYFATSPGNTTLYVAEKKNGIISQLPVI